MKIFESPEQSRRFTMDARQNGRTVGIVPTMGALHDGHLSLVRYSRAICDTTIATIFVNPTQFGPGEDLETYPRTLQQDLDGLSAEEVDAVFVPENATMYPDGFSTFVDPPEVAARLEGVCRPKHFRGVATVVLKLFAAVPATHAFFGRKDYQQWKVIGAMTRDLNLGIEVVGGETIREGDGLALSSRNRYLSEDDRQRAVLIWRALLTASRSFDLGEREVDVLETKMRQALLARGGERKGVDKIDYAEIVDAETLSPIDRIERPAVALIAAHVGSTRLIDNLELKG